MSESQPTPVFDPNRDYGLIAHGALPEGKDPSELPRYLQAGNYFRPDFKFHSTDGQPRKREAPPPDPTSVNTLPGVPADEVEALLQDPRAELLLDTPRDIIVQMVNRLNGPMIAGEGSTRAMIAFIIKHTHKGPPKARAPSVTPVAEALAALDAAGDDELL